MAMAVAGAVAMAAAVDKKIVQAKDELETI